MSKTMQLSSSIMWIRTTTKTAPHSSIWWPCIVYPSYTDLQNDLRHNTFLQANVLIESIRNDDSGSGGNTGVTSTCGVAFLLGTDYSSKRPVPYSEIVNDPADTDLIRDFYIHYFHFKNQVCEEDENGSCPKIVYFLEDAVRDAVGRLEAETFQSDGKDVMNGNRTSASLSSVTCSMSAPPPPMNTVVVPCQRGKNDVETSFTCKSREKLDKPIVTSQKKVIKKKERKIKIGKNDTWKAVWEKMRKIGWCYKNGKGLVSYYYVPPNGSVSPSAKEGFDYFTSEEDVKTYAMKHYHWSCSDEKVISRKRTANTRSSGGGGAKVVTGTTQKRRRGGGAAGATTSFEWQKTKRRLFTE